MTESTPDATGRDPDALRRRAGVRGDPDRDQHFLIDDRVLDRIPEYLPADADRSHVLEVGGGTGALTDRLLRIADRVTVVERDPSLAAFLREEFADAVDDGRLTIREGDALSIGLPAFSACVSNLPYGISSEIAFRLLPTGRPLVLMFQREFGERMAAECRSAPSTTRTWRSSRSSRRTRSTPLRPSRARSSGFAPETPITTSTTRRSSSTS